MTSIHVDLDSIDWTPPRDWRKSAIHAERASGQIPSVSFYLLVMSALTRGRPAEKP